MFNFLKRKNDEPKNTNVEIEKTNVGSHGDHWGAVIGFKSLDTNRQYIMDSIKSTFLKVKPHKSNNHFIFCDNNSPIGSLVISNNINKIITAYPFISVNNLSSLTIKRIIEWKHIDGVEAQIEGVYKESYGIKFFAVDYCNNSKRYSEGTSDIHLAGFAYQISHAPDMPDNFSSNFTCYLPCQSITDIDVFDFIGEIKNFDYISLDKIQGFMLLVTLVSEESKNFDLDIFVHKENMKIEEPKIGMRITGSFWLQGYIDTM